MYWARLESTTAAFGVLALSVAQAAVSRSLCRSSGQHRQRACAKRLNTLKAWLPQSKNRAMPEDKTGKLYNNLIVSFSYRKLNLMAIK